MGLLVPVRQGGLNNRMFYPRRCKRLNREGGERPPRLRHCMRDCLGPVYHISRFETGISRRIPRVRTPARVRGALVCAKQKHAPVALPYLSIAPRPRQQTLPGHDRVRGFFMVLTMYIYRPADSNSNYTYKKLNCGFYESES